MRLTLAEVKHWLSTYAEEHLLDQLDQGGKLKVKDVELDTSLSHGQAVILTVVEDENVDTPTH